MMVVTTNRNDNKCSPKKTLRTQTMDRSYTPLPSKKPKHIRRQIWYAYSASKPDSDSSLKKQTIITLVLDPKKIFGPFFTIFCTFRHPIQPQNSPSSKEETMWNPKKTSGKPPESYDASDSLKLPSSSCAHPPTDLLRLSLPSPQDSVMNAHCSPYSIVASRAQIPGVETGTSGHRGTNSAQY